MPNDHAGQFPTPPSSPTEPAVPSTPLEVPLTDEVAPDLSQSPEVSPRTVASTLDSSEVKPMPIPTPATIAPSRPFPVVTILLLLISTAAIAAAYFFYRQNITLSQQLTEIERTLEQQKIKENQATPTPTPSPTLEITPTGTISATPTPTPVISDNSVFGQISAVITAAQTKYPTAQLLMVTVTGVENPTTMITKYWFRQNESDKRYLYILKEAGRDPALVDQQVYVTPDNNIPSLNQLAAAGQLGIDLPEALGIAGTACPPNFSCNFTPASAQYIKAGTTLWQISYKPTNGSRPFVIQIDSLTKKVLYKNQ